MLLHDARTSQDGLSLTFRIVKSVIKVVRTERVGSNQGGLQLMQALVAPKGDNIQYTEID